MSFSNVYKSFFTGTDNDICLIYENLQLNLQKKKKIGSKNTVLQIFSVLLFRAKPVLQNLPDLDVSIAFTPTVLLGTESSTLAAGWMGFETRWLITSLTSYNLWLINQDKYR